MVYPLSSLLFVNAIRLSGLSDEEFRVKYLNGISQASFSRYKNGKQQVPIEVALEIGLIRPDNLNA